MLLECGDRGDSAVEAGYRAAQNDRNRTNIQDESLHITHSATMNSLKDRRSQSAAGSHREVEVREYAGTRYVRTEHTATVGA